MYNFKQELLKNLFKQKGGNSKLTKAYCNERKGDYEVYTGTTLGTFAKINEYEYEIIGNSELAFDHAEIIIKGIMDLRNKVNNTDILFNLMPEEFTIGELKQVYSLLLGKELVNSAFRRVIAPKIIETGKMISTGGHRPSRLCKYNEGDK